MDVSQWCRLLVVACLAAGIGWGQQSRQKLQEPPEEDESLKPREYGFNPLQAEKDIKVGLYYLKKGKHRAASLRFTEATKWDPTSADAFFHLGEAFEKMKNKAGAKEAYEKFLELAPDSKAAPAIRKKLGTPPTAPR